MGETNAGPQLDLVLKFGIPLHPGVVRYGKEQGAKIPAEMLK